MLNCPEEAIEEMDEELKRIQKEAEQKSGKGLLEEEDLIVPELEEVEDIIAPEITSQDEKTPAAEEEKKLEEQGEEEVEEDFTRSSLGSLIKDEDSTKDDQKENKSGKSPFSSLSLSLASLSLVSSSSLVSMVSVDFP